MQGAKAPSAAITAANQTASNQSTAISQQLLNMVNQVGPGGTSTYSKTGTNSYFDPSIGKTVELPQFTQTTAFSPEEQVLYNQQNQFDKKFNDIGLSQADRIGGLLSTPFHYNTGDHEAWANDLYEKLNGDNEATARSGMDQRLASQGLQAGSQAYDDAMRNLTYGQGKARNDFLLNSYGEGMNTALTERNQPLNEVSSLMGGGGVQQPTFASTPTVGVNGTDIASISQQAYQNKANKQAAVQGGLFGLGSAALSGWAMSDENLKEDIEQIGETPIDGVNVYQFRYKGSPLMNIGAMAQEVEKKVPEAVATHSSGYKMVNYDKLRRAMAA